LRSLVGVLAEEAAFVLCRVNWEAPFQGPFFEVIDDFLNGMRGFSWIREGPDGKVINIE